MTDIDPVIREEIERQEADQDAADFIADVLSQRVGFAELARPLPPIPWIVPGLRLCPGAPQCFGGYGYSGKTLALQSLALSVAAGADVWGVYSCKAARVLHVDYEQGLDLCTERYQVLARGMGLELLDLAEHDNLHLLSFPTLYLDHYKARDRWARIAEHYRLVIIDSLSAAAPSADELSRDIRKPLDALGWASQRTGATFIIVHHASKGSRHVIAGQDEPEAKYSLRGNSAIFDGLGGCFIFDAKKGEPTKVHHEKERRTGRTLDSFGLRFEDLEAPEDVETWPGKEHGTAYGVRVAHLAPEQLEERAAEKREQAANRLDGRVLDAVGKGKASSSNALCRQLGGRRQAILDAIRDLVDRGKLLRKNGILTLPNGVASHDQFPSVPPLSSEPADPRERGGGSLP